MKVENSIEEDIKILEELRIANENCIKNAKIKDNPFAAIWEKQNRAIEHILKELKRFENMYEAEKRIHIVRNEQLARKQQLVIKCNELENENKELKKENEKLVIKLKKENKELKEEKDVDYTTVYLKRCLRWKRKTAKKIKDKIEELDERIKNPEKNSYWASYKISECIGIRSILQELLKRGKNE